MLYILVLVILIFLIGILIFAFSGNKRQLEILDKPNYKLFFILGIIFFVAGTAMMFFVRHPGFLAIAILGFIFLVLGLANRSKWR